MITTSSLKCGVCNQLIDESEREFAESDEQHPGILGPAHKACYNAQVDVQPDLPWTDPISGEIDFEGMSEDLGVSDGSEEEFDELW